MYRDTSRAEQRGQRRQKLARPNRYLRRRHLGASSAKTRPAAASRSSSWVLETMVEPPLRRVVSTQMSPALAWASRPVVWNSTRIDEDRRKAPGLEQIRVDALDQHNVGLTYASGEHK